MTNAVPTLLVTRAADLVRLGVSWDDATLESGAGGAPILVAGDHATMTLIFPPQALAEQSIEDDSVAVARLGGPSQLTFALAAGDRVPLDAEGILAALHEGKVIAANTGQDQTGTLLETPVGLTLTTIGEVQAFTAARPAGEGVTNAALWRVDLRNAEGVLALRPLASASLDADLSGLNALNDRNRRDILASGGPIAAHVTLSALGATFDAELETESLSWAHRAVLGRDSQVTVVERGVLYPLGHRATVTTTTLRKIGADGLPAALHTDRQIIVTEPVRSTPRPDFRFAAVEIQTRKLKFTSSIREHKQPVPPDLTLSQVQERDQADADIATAQADVTTYADLVRGGWPALDVAGYEWSNRYGECQRKIDELNYSLEHIDEEAGTIGVPAIRAALKEQQALAAQLKPHVDEEVASVKFAYDEARAREKEARDRYNRLTAEIDAITEATRLPPVVAFWPADDNGQEHHFDVRMATPRGDIIASMPLVFVSAVTPESPYLPPFDAVSDRSILRNLADDWDEFKGGEIDLPGLSFDLVQAHVPEAGDIHEIYKITVKAAELIETYVPHIAEIEAKIASLRALLPDSDKAIKLVYNLADSADLAPLKPLVPIAIDFIQQADKSGGLAAPKFAANMLSRTMGPAAEAALDAAHLPDLAALYKDARLLGLSLGELIDTAKQGVSIEGGPTIVPILDGLRPVGVSMTWSKLPLKAAGIFKPFDNAIDCTLDISATISSGDTKTTATVSNFALALPPGAAVVTIGFASLQMIQEAGKPPQVKVEKFSFELADEFELLAKLQEEVQSFFGVKNPGIVVRRTPNGIAAGYAFSLPEVACGVFLMRNLGASIDLDIPFDGQPVSTTIGFASPGNPFALAVTIFGGGGWFQIKLGPEGVQSFKLSLTFGAFVAVSFAIAKGEVHASGSLTIQTEEVGYSFDATLRLGGSIDVLGIVSVSIELVLSMRYRAPPDNRLEGQATLVIEIHLLFFSRSVTIDSGVWILAGSDQPAAHRLANGGGSTPLDPVSAQTEWQNYWGAFSTWTP